MASFVALTPVSSDGQLDPEGTSFVRDGFSILAFVFPIPWLLLHRLWIEGALVLAATVVISLVGSYTNHDGLAAIIAALLAVLVGFEGNNWRVSALQRRGYKMQAVVDADNQPDAETSYYSGFDSVEAESSPAPEMVRPSKPMAGRSPSGMVGLVSHRGEN